MYFFYLLVYVNKQTARTMSVSYTHSGGFITTNRSCDDLVGTGDMSVAEDFSCAGTSLIATATGLCGSSVTSKTQLTAGSVSLSKNTVYIAPTASMTVTIPTAATSTKGDVIVVEFHADVANSAALKFGTSGEFFMAGSVIYKSASATATASDVADGTADAFLNLAGTTNGGPGVGSKLVFSFNGSKWSVEANLTSAGTAVDANASAFSAS